MYRQKNTKIEKKKKGNRQHLWVHKEKQIIYICNRNTWNYIVDKPLKSINQSTYDSSSLSLSLSLSHTHTYIYWESAAKAFVLQFFP